MASEVLGVTSEALKCSGGCFRGTGSGVGGTGSGFGGAKVQRGLLKRYWMLEVLAVAPIGESYRTNHVWVFWRLG